MYTLYTRIKYTYYIYCNIIILPNISFNLREMISGKTYHLLVRGDARPIAPAGRGHDHIIIHSPHERI